MAGAGLLCGALTAARISMFKIFRVIVFTPRNIVD